MVDFPVPDQIPVAGARGALEQAAARLWEEPAWHSVMLDRPQVWGVENVSADTVLIRVAARTAPPAKLDAARVLRERLKDAIDTEAGGRGPGPRRLGAAAARVAGAVIIGAG